MSRLDDSALLSAENAGRKIELEFKALWTLSSVELPSPVYLDERFFLPSRIAIADSQELVTIARIEIEKPVQARRARSRLDDQIHSGRLPWLLNNWK